MFVCIIECVYFTRGFVRALHLHQRAIDAVAEYWQQLHAPIRLNWLLSLNPLVCENFNLTKGYSLVPQIRPRPFYHQFHLHLYHQSFVQTFRAVLHVPAASPYRTLNQVFAQDPFKFYLHLLRTSRFAAVQLEYGFHLLQSFKLSAERPNPVAYQYLSSA
jgi:hypothetical protein